jgi:predicted nucleic acid-binding protein
LNNNGNSISVAVDATVCISLIQNEELHILGELPGYSFHVPDEVVREVRRPAQAQELESAIESGGIERIAITDPNELLVFAELRDGRRLGAGESACIALAQSRNWHIATDELRRCRREILRRLGVHRLLTTEALRQLARTHNILRQS